MGGRKVVNSVSRCFPLALEASFTLTRELEICFADAQAEKADARGRK
jgi:hypothetical protein